MSKLSFDIGLNTSQYQQGAKQAEDANKKLEKSTKEYLESFGSLTKQLRTAKTEARNLAAQFSQLSKTERESEIGKHLAEELEIAIKKSAELKDVMNDVDNSIAKAASDTSGIDGLIEVFGIGKSAAMGFAGALAKVGGDAKSLDGLIKTLAITEGAFGTVTKLTTALQKDSKTMTALQQAGVISLTQAQKINNAVTIASTAATKALGVAMKALPYVAVAAGIVALAKAFVSFTSNSDKLATSTAKVQKELTKQERTIKDIAQTYNSNYAQALGKTLSLYKQLQSQYSKLSSVQEKNRWIKENADKFKELGIKIGTVNDAEHAFITDSGKMITGFQERAKAAAEAANLVRLYTEMIEARAEAERKAAKFKAGDYVHGSDVERYGLTEGDYKYKSNGVDKVFTEEGAKKANDEAVKKNIQTMTSDIQAEIDKSVARIEKSTEKANNALGDLGNPKDNDNNQKAENVAKNILPDESKLKNIIVKHFETIAKTVKEEQKKLNEAQEKQNTSSNNILSSNINISAVTEKINHELNDVELEWDFSSLPESLQEAANKGVEALDRIINAMHEATEAKYEFMRTGDTAGVEAMNEQLDSLSQKYEEQTELLDSYTKKAKNIEKLSSAFEDAGNAMNAIGDLFSSLASAGGDEEDATTKAMGIIFQTLATLALSFANAMKSCNTWVEWLIFGATGMAQLVAMTQQIKQLTAETHAGGGIVGGNSFFGDKVLAGLNSGEMVMNGNQQQRLWNILNGTNQAVTPGNNSVQVEGVIRGKDILLASKNYNTVSSRNQKIRIS